MPDRQAIMCVGY